jgi:hypothetical protein
VVSAARASRSPIGLVGAGITGAWSWRQGAEQREPEDPAERQPDADHHHPQDLDDHFFARSGLYQLGAHAGQRPAKQPRDVHLGAADLGRGGVLFQLLEEPQDDDPALQLGQGRDRLGKNKQVVGILVR